MSLERKAFIFNIQKYNTYDGPGVRTLVFFKGCPLRCKWCSNPEGLQKNYQIMYKADRCVNCGACVEVCPQKIHKMNSENIHEVNRSISCIGCGECEKVCLQGANNLVGEEKTISELMEVVEMDRPFYEVSGGGLTLGGGEVTGQVESATNLLMACKQSGINTAIETCGYVKKENLLKIAEFTDLFLYDLKHADSDKHFEWTGVRNENIIENLITLLEKRKKVIIRMPLLKGVNSSEEDIRKAMELLVTFKDYKNLLGIELLPYHKLGVNKYKQLDMEYPLDDDHDPALSDEDLEKIEKIIECYDIPVKIVKH